MESDIVYTDFYGMWKHKDAHMKTSPVYYMSIINTT